MLWLNYVIVSLLSLQIVAANDQETEEKLLEICNGQTKTIENVAEIQLMAKILRDDVTMKLRCQSIVASVFQLDEMTRNVNCGPKLAEQIVRFKRHYLNYKKHPKSSERYTELNEAILSFFLRFAIKLTELCGQQLASNLKQIDANLPQEVDSLMKTDLGAQVEELKLRLVNKKDINSLDDFVLYWRSKAWENFAYDYPKLSRTSRNLPFLIVKSRDPSEVWRMQQVCKDKLRPRYIQTTWPLMILIDAGYMFNKHKLSGDEINIVKDWYHITQMCEFVLQIVYYRDEAIDSTKVVMFEDPEEVLETKALERRDFSSSEEIVSDELSTKIQFPDQLPITMDLAKMEAKCEKNKKRKADFSGLKLIDSLMSHRRSMINVFKP